jgi:hypothetical protein
MMFCLDDSVKTPSNLIPESRPIPNVSKAELPLRLQEVSYELLENPMGRKLGRNPHIVSFTHNPR